MTTNGLDAARAIADAAAAQAGQAGAVERVAAVLAEHGTRSQPYALVCDCGKQWEHGGLFGPASERHRDHLAAAIIAALAPPP